MRIPALIRRDEGGVLVIVSILLPLLLLLSAGGVVSFTVTAAHRELQRAVDQAALAGAAALPPFDPNLLVAHSPVPLPDSDEYYDMLPDQVQDIVPRMGDLIPDPRIVACTVGSQGNMGEGSSRLITAFEDRTGLTIPTGDDGEPLSTACEDIRFYPVIEPNPDATTPVQCANRLVQKVAEDFGDIDATIRDTLPPLVNDTILKPIIDPITGLIIGWLTTEVTDPVFDTIQAELAQFVRMPLNNVLPALFTPRMRVDAYSFIHPPMLEVLGWYRTVQERRDGGPAQLDEPVTNPGLQLQARAVAHRRIKNAVVVPILPEQRILLETTVTNPLTGEKTPLINPLTGEPYQPIDFMTDPVNLNTALHEQQSTLIDALDDVDNRIAEVMQDFGLPCEHMLQNLRQDLRDIYSPPTGPAPSALDLVDSAITAAENTAARTGIPEPDVDDPASLAGEAFVLIGVTVDEFMQPIADSQIPILDVALVSMSRVADGDYRAAVISGANAYGAFRAVLVE